MPEGVRGSIVLAIVMVRGDGHVMVVMVRGDGHVMVVMVRSDLARRDGTEVPRRIYSPSGQAAAERVLLRHGCDGNGMSM